MAPIIDALSDWVVDRQAMAFATNVGLQITLFLALVLFLARRFRRDAALRYYLLLSALLGVLIIPAIAAGFQRASFSLLALPVSWTVPTVGGPQTQFDLDLSLGNIHTPEEREINRGHVVAKPPHAARMDAAPRVASPSVASYIPRATAILVMIWLAGCVVGLTGLVRSHQRLRRILRRARPVELSRHRSVEREICRILGVPSFPPTFCSSSVDSPTVAGIRQPRILIPCKLMGVLTNEELRDVLLHETAHVLRRDQIVLLLQQVIGVVLWPHPLIHLLNAHLARAREEVCDNFVLSVAAPVEYGRTLLRVCELMPRPRIMPGAIGMLHRHWRLEDRISDLLDSRRNPGIHVHSSRASMITVCLLALLVVVAGSQFIRAAAPPAAGDAGNNRPAESTPAAERETEVSQTAKRLIGALNRRPMADIKEQGLLNVFAIDVARGDVTLVANSPQPELNYCGTPCWSHDGARIYFDATPNQSWSRTRLLVVDLLKMTADPTDLGAGNCPSPSPDGKRIAFQLNTGAGGIWVMDADGTNRRRLGGSGIPKWSPDGKKLLVTGFSSDRKLSLVDAETGEVEPISLAGHKFYSQTSWGGDPDSILSVVVSDRGTGIALVDISTPSAAKIKRVLWRRGEDLNVAPACPVYSTKTHRCVFTGRAKTGTALYILRTDKDEPAKRLEPEIEDNKIASLAFSPDGRYVLFCSDRPILKSE